MNFCFDHNKVDHSIQTKVQFKSISQTQVCCACGWSIDVDATPDKCEVSHDQLPF